MSEYDAATYERFSSAVQRQVHALRVILDNLQITIERDSNEDVSEPKHGKEDPDNMPHVGGNTWAGGTGQ